MSSSYQKTGYLNSDFRTFYLTSTESQEILGHYHDFHKILYFQSGSVSYYVEGESYQLQPDDIVLVSAGEVHRPVIHNETPYHRLILYISPAFFEEYQAQGIDLARCFTLCSRQHTHILRIHGLKESRIYPQLRELIQGDAFQTDATALLYQRSVVLQFLILLSHLADGGDITFPAATRANPQIMQVIAYINDHLYEDLPIDRIASACYLNRSYLMHLFRRETGCTLGSYITEKRLFAARTLIQSGVPVTDACMQCGFSGYSAFYRAYRKKFGSSPKESRM